MKIIIGASGGIGSKLFEHYSKDETDGLIGTFLNNGEESEYMWKVDITNYLEVETFAESIDLHDGQITLINCAGITIDGMAHKMNPQDFWDVIEVNLVGTFNVIRAFLSFMRHWGYGRIINMGSVVAQKGVAGTSAYAASKAGLWGMTKAIAEENREKNITINTLNLGYMDGGMGRRIEAPLELGGIDSIINAIDFLVDSPFVTGTSIDINGGLI
jgi:NAD(P)-dependent dehydrogenase (short-subunit alcohol dehydrogenase family)